MSSELIEMAFPVGFVFVSKEARDMSEVFPGTEWENLGERMIPEDYETVTYLESVARLFSGAEVQGVKRFLYQRVS